MEGELDRTLLARPLTQGSEAASVNIEAVSIVDDVYDFTE